MIKVNWSWYKVQVFSKFQLIITTKLECFLCMSYCYKFSTHLYCFGTNCLLFLDQLYCFFVGLEKNGLLFLRAFITYVEVRKAFSDTSEDLCTRSWFLIITLQEMKIMTSFFTFQKVQNEITWKSHNFEKQTILY